uniref:Uncharacterized protein n=1 Tax=Anguilla anguilla TaxID=7936 RepID=A0A0E9TVH6_ANGAN
MVLWGKNLPLSQFIDRKLPHWKMNSVWIPPQFINYFFMQCSIL